MQPVIKSADMLRLIRAAERRAPVALYRLRDLGYETDRASLARLRRKVEVERTKRTARAAIRGSAGARNALKTAGLAGNASEYRALEKRVPTTPQAGWQVSVDGKRHSIVATKREAIATARSLAGKARHTVTGQTVTLTGDVTVTVERYACERTPYAIAPRKRDMSAIAYTVRMGEAMVTFSDKTAAMRRARHMTDGSEVRKNLRGIEVIGPKGIATITAEAR